MSGYSESRKTYPDGPAPRFGSCFFLLRPNVAKRSTFTFGGSHEDCALDRTGTPDVMEPVFAPLLSQLESGKGAFAVADLSVKDCLTRMTHTFSASFPDPASRPLGHALDSFIEVQVHGELSLENDMERLLRIPRSGIIQPAKSSLEFRQGSASR